MLVRLRMGEAEEIISLFRGHYNIPLAHLDASAPFLERDLAGFRRAIAGQGRRRDDAYGAASQLDGSLLADNNRKEEHCFS
jgi:hypothetical protein